MPTLQTTPPTSTPPAEGAAPIRLLMHAVDFVQITEADRRHPAVEAVRRGPAAFIVETADGALPPSLLVQAMDADTDLHAGLLPLPVDRARALLDNHLLAEPMFPYRWEAQAFLAGFDRALEPVDETTFRTRPLRMTGPHGAAGETFGFLRPLRHSRADAGTPMTLAAPQPVRRSA